VAKRRILRRSYVGCGVRGTKVYKEWIRTLANMSKNRNFIFTHNNYLPEDVTRYNRMVANDECRYLTYGRETGESGTRHLQGYIVFANPRAVGGVRKFLKGCHVEIRRGTHTQAKEYCQKDGEYFEDGEQPIEQADKGALEVERWKSIWECAKRGAIEEIPERERIRHYSTLKRIGQDYLPKVVSLEGVCGIWIHGESGSGKSRSVMDQFPEHFPKPLTIWWTGYQQEEVVLLDDIDKFNVALGGLLKQWADEKPFIGQVHGGSCKIRPKRFIVTSQYTIEEIWEDKATRDALNRRFKKWEKRLNEPVNWISLE